MVHQKLDQDSQASDSALILTRLPTAPTYLPGPYPCTHGSLSVHQWIGRKSVCPRFAAKWSLVSCTIFSTDTGWWHWTHSPSLPAICWKNCSSTNRLTNFSAHSASRSTDVSLVGWRVWLTHMDSPAVFFYQSYWASSWMSDHVALFDSGQPFIATACLKSSANISRWSFDGITDGWIWDVAVAGLTAKWTKLQCSSGSFIRAWGTSKHCSCSAHSSRVDLDQTTRFWWSW